MSTTTLDHNRPASRLDRRAFLSGLAVAGAAALSPEAIAQGRRPSLAKWRDRIGLQLFTVRDHFQTDYRGMLKSVSDIGFRHVQTTLNYGGLSFDEVKAALDQNRLAAVATHVNPPNGAEFERTLDAYARIGHRYTTVSSPPPAPLRAQTSEEVKRTAAQLNAAGAIAKKHGLKVIVHNHTEEFEPLTDNPRQRPYDLLIAETDPDLVALELDIGWATAAGANALELFRQAPGRFEVWHVKDMADLKSLQGLSPVARHRAAKIVTLGTGEIDYRPIFAAADQAGLKNFYVEQDTATASGDSMAAAAANYRYLSALLV